MIKNVIGVIPARYASSRLPGKPLIKLGDKPMIQLVYERAKQAELVSQVLVATDDERIIKAVEGFGGKAVMTSKEIPSGTDRVALVADEIGADIIINIQGDEPFIEPDEINDVAQLLLNDEQAVMGTLIKKMNKVDELDNPNIVKVVVDCNGYALFFSRFPIPYCRDDPSDPERIHRHVYYKHLGLYSYRKDFLARIVQWGPSKLESIEKLEQLRILENGYRIKVAKTQFEPFCVDTPEDVQKAESMLKRRNPFESY